MTKINYWIIVLLGLICSFGLAEAKDGEATESHRKNDSRISDTEIAIEISPKSKESDDLIIKVRFSGQVGDERWISDVVVFWVTPTGEGLSLLLRPVTEKLFAISVRGPLTSGSHILHASLTVRDREGYVQNLYERRYHLEAPSLELEMKEKRNFSPATQASQRAIEIERLGSEAEGNLEKSELADSQGKGGLLKTTLLLVGLLGLGGGLYFFRSRILDVAALAAHLGGGLIDGAVEMAERRGLMKSGVVRKMAAVVERIGRPFRKDDEARLDKNAKALKKSPDRALGAAAESLGEDLTNRDTVMELAEGREDEGEGVTFVGEDDDENPNAPAEDKDQDESSEIDRALVKRDTEGIVVIGEGDKIGGIDQDESQANDTSEKSENAIANDEPDSSRPEPNETGAADDGSIASDSPEPLESEITNLEGEGESAKEQAGQEISASSKAADSDGPSPLQETGT